MEKKTSIFLIILLCILVAVTGGSVSWAYLNKAHNDETEALSDQIDRLESDIAKARNTSKTTPTPTITPTVTAAAPTATDPTANWKTYASTLGKYTVKYPATWVYGKDSVNDATTAGYSSQAIWYKNQAEKDGQVGQQYQVDITTSATTKTLAQEVATRESAITQEDPNITMSKVIITLGVHQTVAKMTVSGNITYLFVENGKLFQISTGQLADTSTKNIVVEQMISKITLF